MTYHSSWHVVPPGGPWACTYNYLPLFYKVSHPYVIPPKEGQPLCGLKGVGAECNLDAERPKKRIDKDSGKGGRGAVVTRLLIQAITIGTLTNLLGVLEINIITGARKVIGILDLVMLIKTPFREAIAVGTQQMPQAMMV
ncbi:hypothetical protein JHK86_055576 [Glycine max]|nr:hypothetical protein JHK86_055576 [Glycine max]